MCDTTAEARELGLCIRSIITGWCAWKAIAVVEQDEEVKGATGMGDLRGQSAGTIVSDIENTLGVGDEPGDRWARLTAALATASFVRKECLREKVCVLCVAKELLLEDGDQVDMLSDNLAEEQENIYARLIDRGWDAFFPSLRDNVDNYLAVCAAAHNREMHAANCNIDAEREEDFTAVFRELVKLHYERPT